MKIAERLSFFLISLILIINALGGAGCANILPPTGGPKDTLPPVLVSAVPKNMILHFNGNRITFTFDEYVTLDKIQENLVISPTPKINPIVDSKLKTVTIKLKDTLRPNTTYQFNFGNAIKDVNEGNTLKHFSYVFSTGSYIDSLEFSGRVVVAKTGKADSTLIVVLHKNLDDSAIVNDRPPYVTTLDSAGFFTFRYLAPGTYALYAFRDQGNARKYFSKSDLFAFADKPIEINGRTPTITLYAFAEEEDKKKTNKPTGTKSSSKSEKAKEKDKRLIMKTNLTAGELDILGNLEFDFATPLKDFDSTKLHFTDEQFKEITNYRLITTNDTLHKTIELVYKWEPDTKYNIIAEKDFAQDTSGRKLLKADTIAIHTRRESEYGELDLRFRNLDLSKNPVLQFIQGDDIKFSFPLTSREFKRALFLPGEYKLSILYDDNKNGVWDAGEFFGKHKQPEKVQQVLLNNKKNALNIRSNWDNDVDITL